MPKASNRGTQMYGSAEEGLEAAEIAALLEARDTTVALRSWLLKLEELRCAEWRLQAAISLKAMGYGGRTVELREYVARLTDQLVDASRRLDRLALAPVLRCSAAGIVRHAAAALEQTRGASPGHP